MSLSCDPAQETLSVCIHGAPVKFGRCLLCNPMERKTVNIGDLIDELISLRNRIEALHEHKLRQIDENRKVSKHLDSIDASIKVNKKIEERFDKLEKFHSDWNKMPKFDLHTWQEGIQKQINDVIGLFVKADSVLENDIIKLQQSRESHSRNHKDIFERLEKIEQFNEKFKNALRNDIDRYQYTLNNYEERIEKLETSKDKKPHRCPKCNGDGILYDISTGITYNMTTQKKVNCHACEK